MCYTGPAQKKRLSPFGLNWPNLTSLTLGSVWPPGPLTLISHFNALTAASDMTDGPGCRVLNTTLLEDRRYICAEEEKETQTI